MDNLDFEAEQMSGHKMVSNKVGVEHDDIELEQGHGDNVDDNVSTCTVDTD